MDRDDAAKARALRRDGRTYREIASVLGCSVGTAHKLVKPPISSRPRRSPSDVEEHRAAELARLNGLQRDVEALVDEVTDHLGIRLAAYELLLGISEARSQLLGLCT